MTIHTTPAHKINRAWRRAYMAAYMAQPRVIPMAIRFRVAHTWANLAAGRWAK